ncbi:uncharacterized protein LAESUDRAFT_760643 [Laetiporus sulphureus 93-53]|uniref:Uncharacterized protein n=1 Tax=Laetiporus sulphureus 93-53 TaxID=1314785 RepID=A0A165DHI7_9APHY|nr:uncharacterized protein LAESUDRAFT_760643 [Laetiporus sulphureus 93-53]KZT04892.1 hypothetical protein LAESUDRAFT_760643 [Laetiporus sulphureus 93-53]
MTNVLAGGFATRSAQPESLVQMPPYPPATTPTRSSNSSVHSHLTRPSPAPPSKIHCAADPATVLSKDANAPLRVPLGKDVFVSFQAQGQLLLDDTARNEALSKAPLVEGT